MANATDSSSLRGLCPPPFYDPAQFGNDGYTAGRFCAPATTLDKGLHCCLPCPATDYLFSPEFKTAYRSAEILNVVGLGLLALLLLSFVCLPAEKTRRHYLSFCLIIAAIFMALGFVIPFATRPDQCYDAITPNDMYSDLSCAFSGAFLCAGGMSIAVWIFIRALSMHLQICWDILPGKKFFYCSQVLGWAVASAFFTITTTVTGYSFRFGDVCHVNSTDSMKDFWGPLLAIAGAATLVQLVTFAYCIKVYVGNMWSDDRTETQSSAGLPSYTSSSQKRTARVVYRRVSKVLWLQWRSIAIVIIILVDVIFFSVVFIFLNQVESRATKDLTKALPFLLCLVEHPGNTVQCDALGQKIFVNQDTAVAVLIMLSLAGIQCFFLLGRTSMITAWWELFHSKFSSKREFVSLDAKHEVPDVRNYELSKFPAGSVAQPEKALSSPMADSRSAGVRSPSSATFDRVRSPSSVTFDRVHSPTFDRIQSPTSATFDPYRRSLTGTPDHFGKEAQREYRSPSLSFSTPRVPQSPTHADWDPRSTHARGGLGLHPIDDEEDDGMHNKI